MSDLHYWPQRQLKPPASEGFWDSLKLTTEPPVCGNDLEQTSSVPTKYRTTIASGAPITLVPGRQVKMKTQVLALVGPAVPAKSGKFTYPDPSEDTALLPRDFKGQ